MLKKNLMAEILQPRGIKLMFDLEQKLSTS